MPQSDRRKFIKAGLLGGALVISGNAVARKPTHMATPVEVEGPFYPVQAQKDTDFDLTHVEGREGRALGNVITIKGKIIDTGGRPVEDATVDLWQANAAGRYRHPHDSNTAPLDPNFQGWAIVPSGKDGGFVFTTIMPGTYPASSNWMRPPHIHFKISKRGYVELTTQMYFPGHELNEVDRLYQRKSKDEQRVMTAIESTRVVNLYKYTIVLEKA